MNISIAPYNLIFKTPAGTSRGVLQKKQTYFIKVWDKNPELFGIGEAAIFRGLSAEDNSSYIGKMGELINCIKTGKPIDLSHYSSIQFGLEQAIFDFKNGGNGIYFRSDFLEGRQTIKINGLVWMGNFEQMIQRIDEKISQGFDCIKLKIGAIDFKKELDMIKHIRNNFNSDKLQIRVDANGGFSANDALYKIQHLAEFDIHSIEQPIKAGQITELAKLCKYSPIAVALDEELIGICNEYDRKKLLDNIVPQYIILKPALCGGFSGASNWIHLAHEREIGWWVTSALESNIGLNALAQWTATLNTNMPQGLGTGALFTNNFECNLELNGDKLKYNHLAPINRAQFNHLEWH